MSHLQSQQLPTDTDKQILNLIDFYSRPSLPVPKKHISNTSLASQLSRPILCRSPKNPTNLFDLLEDSDPDSMTSMEDDSNEQTPQIKCQTPIPNVTTKTWVTDPFITKLSGTLLQTLHQEHQKQKDSREDPMDIPQYNTPTNEAVVKINQSIRFNLIRSRNSDTSTPMLQLFKSFVTALEDSDQFLSLLSLNSSKQTLPSMSNKSQIASADKNKIQLYFKSYFN